MDSFEDLSPRPSSPAFGILFNPRPVDDSIPKRTWFESAESLWGLGGHQGHGGPSPSFFDSSARHKPAILRVWGVVAGGPPFQRMWPTQGDTGLQVYIQSHEDAEEIDLLQPRWFASRQATAYSSVTFAEAGRHSDHLLDRLSFHDDWRPIVRVVDFEVEPGILEPVCFCLFDRTRAPGVVNRDGTYMTVTGDRENGKVTDCSMSEGLGQYIARLRRQGTGDALPSGQKSAGTATDESAGRAVDCHTAATAPQILRGRRRRQMRRHPLKDLQALVMRDGSKPVPLPTPAPVLSTGDTAGPVQHILAPNGLVLRGRKRRRNRRHGLDQRHIRALPNTPSQNRAGPAVALNTESSFAILSCLPGGTRLAREVLSVLERGPVFWLKTTNPAEFDSELLVLPIHYDDGDGRNLGHLVLPKESIKVWVDQSWVDYMTTDGVDCWVERLFVLNQTGSSPALAQYWDKFLTEAFDEFTDGLRPTNLTRNTVGDVELALGSSFQNPLLVFPDSNSGALADEKEHLKTWFALDTNVDRVIGLKTSDFLAWNTSLSRNWHYERLVELKDVLDRGFTANDHVFSDKGPAVHAVIPHLADKGPIEDDALLFDYETDFALELQRLETEAVGGGLSGGELESQPEPRGEDLADRAWGDPECREFFYGSRYFSAIPRECQAQTVERIAKIAAYKRHPVQMRALAVLELGICVLAGFGVDRDVNRGLELVLEAAKGGIRKARAVVRRLSRSYRHVDDEQSPVSWVTREAMSGSHWALEELSGLDRSLYDETLQGAALYRAVGVKGASYLEEVIEPRCDLFDPGAVQEQLVKEFASANRRGDGKSVPRVFALSSNSSPALEPFSPDQPEPSQTLEAFGIGGNNALGLFTPVMKPESPPTFEAVGVDGNEALGLFSSAIGLGAHQTPGAPTSDIVPRAASEPSPSPQEEMDSINPLGLFTPVTEADTPLKDEASAEDSGDVGVEVDERNALGLFTLLANDNPLGLLTSAGDPDPLTFEASAEDPIVALAPNLFASPSYTQHEHTAPAQPKEDVPVTENMALRPSEFFDAAIRFVCCCGPQETLRVLLQEQPRMAPGLALEMYIPVALAAGQGEAALALLEAGAKTTKNNGRYLLFQLHHLPAQQVGPVAQALVDRGFDVNEKVELHRSKRFTQDRLSVFFETDPDLGDWAHYRNPDPETLSLQHWLPEIRGRSLTPLRWALYLGNEHVVKVLLDLGAEFPRLPDVETCAARRGPVDKRETQAFTVAVLEEPCFNMDILEMFFRRHGHQPGRAVFAETPLGLIAMEPDCPERRLRFAGPRGGMENLDQVLSLLRRYQPGSDAELFWAAAMNGHEDIVRYLIREGVNIETRHNGQTPLHTAVLHGQKGVFQLLVDSGANVHALTSDRGMSLMHLLLWTPKTVSTELFMMDELHRLLGARCVAGGSGDFGKKVHPIHLAALNSRVAALKRLLELGADPTVPIGEDIMPSIRGCLRHTGWKLPETLDKGPADGSADQATAICIKGLTPAGIILARCDVISPTDLLAMLRLLVLSESSPVNLARLYTRPSIRQTVFHLLACHFPLTETGILEHLLRHPALARSLPQGTDPINLRDADGDAPLHYAALVGGGGSSRNTRAVDRLLALGADPAARNARGMTPGTIGARYFVWKGAAALAAAAAAHRRGGGDSAAAGSGDDGGDGGRWGGKIVQFGVPPSPEERFTGTGPLPLSSGGDQGVARSRPYWGGRTASCLRLRELGGEDAETGEVKMMGQLLRGARVREVWDLHAGRSVVFGRDMMVKLVTEADMNVDFAQGDRV